MAIRLGEGEFAEEGTSRAYIDVNQVQSFWETTDDCVVIEMENGDGFKVRDSLEEVVEWVKN